MIKKKIIVIDEDKCTGCGNCVTDCHEGALEIIDGKAKLVREDFCDGLGNCIGSCPTGALKIVEKEIKEQACACPGSAMRFTPKGTKSANITVIPPEIRQWPLQLHLVNPSAPYFKDQELVVLSTCSPIASPDVNWKFIRGRAVVIACPKLDKTEKYAEKLAAIFNTANTTKVHVVMMEVPCCRGLAEIVNEALQISGRDDLAVEEHIVKIPL
jgi:NAD-dependent dihydropyrimidine dehydrogenase PreA subunit